MLKGIDVSSNQGNPDWGRIKAAGIQFGILRTILQSGRTDQSFVYNYDQMGVNALYKGVYVYSYDLSYEDARSRADKLLALLRGRKLDMPVWLDLEWDSQRAAGKTVVAGVIRGYLDALASSGYELGIYCNLDWYKNVIPKEYKSLPLWIARYPSADNGIIKESLQPDVGEAIWQYSSKGSVPGITGAVDLNICYRPFWGESQPDHQYYLHEVWHVDSIAGALESIGEDGAYANRQRIAVANGMRGYTGLAVENLHMLNLLRTGQLKRA